ncbi:MAG: BCCT family transporter, partial [Clostridiales bacterium]
AILITVAVIIGIVIPEQFGKAANWAFGFTTTNFGWFYAVGSTLLLVFCLWAGFSKYGKIKLGGKDAKPEMSFFSWFAVALTSGIAIGIVFYGIAEPLGNFTSPPGFTGWEANSPDAAEGALKYVFMHWGLHPYAIYTAAGLCCAFMFWNAKKKFQVSSSLYPIFGEKMNGTPGKIINGLCIFAIVGGIGTSLGIGVTQLSAGINYVFGTNYSDTALALFVISGMAIFYITAACTGLHKGIKYVSNANMYIYFALMIWAFLFGGTLFILNNTSTAIGQYIALIIPQSFYLEPVKQTGWVSGWTIFYWAWWLSFAPLVGLFLIKLAKGRTIRQFVLVNMVAPSVFAIAWFGI